MTGAAPAASGTRIAAWTRATVAVAVGALLAHQARAQQQGRPPDADTGVAVPARPPDSASRESGRAPRLSLDDVVLFPIVWGFRVPSYDRSDGVSLRWGPQLALPDDRLVVDALVTYRTHLGHVDPSVGGVGIVTPRFSVRASLERTTLSNDGWAVSDLVNSIATLIDGADQRNYFRADRAEATGEWHAQHPNESLDGAVYLGVRDEFSHSAGPDSAPAHLAWSLLSRSDSDGVRRPNPAVARGRIVSAVGGVGGQWKSPAGGSVNAKLGLEVPWSSPGTARFAQFTADASIAFRLFTDHQFDLFAHSVVTAGGRAPPQRFSYLGGGSTLPTLRLLSEGGDELLYIASGYAVPLHALALPFVGVPTVGVRYVVGGAGVQRLPTITQNVGLRLQLLTLRVDFLIDPATHRHAISFSGIVPHS